MTVDEIDSLDSFVTALTRVVDVKDVETIYPAGEDMPGIEQGEVSFVSTAAPDERVSRSHVEYRGLSNEARDLRLFLGTVPEEEWERSELKGAVESIVQRYDREGRAGVIIADGMLNQLLKSLADSTPLGSELRNEFDGVGVTVVTTGGWDAERMVSFIGNVQSDFLGEVL